MRSLAAFFKKHTMIGGMIVAAALLSCWASIDLLADESSAEPNLKVRVDKFTPEGDTQRQTNITITFSDNLVPDDSLNKPTNNHPVQFDPPIPGYARWIEPNTLRFFPDEELRPATKYTAKIISSGSYLGGNRISESRTFQFRTAPLGVVNSNWYSQLDEADPTKVRIYGYVIFNYDVMIQSMKDHVSIRGKEGATVADPDFTIANEQESTDDGRALTARSDFSIISSPIPIAKARQEYQIRISPGLACRECQETLGAEFLTTLRVDERRPLTVQNLYSQPEGKGVNIVVDLSQRVALETAKSHIKISPETDFRLDADWRRITIRGDFVPGESYTVTLTPGIKAIDGAELEREFSSTVKIRDLDPGLTFLAKGAYLPRTGAKMLEVETINVDTLLIEVKRIFTNNVVFALTSGLGGDDRWGSPDFSSVGKDYFEKEKALDYVKNQPLTTTLDLGAIIGDTARGVYKVYARDKQRRWQSESRMALLTDLGISARLGEDYLMVWVNSLESVTPVSGATVTLMSKNNQPLLTGKTDGKGVAVFNQIKEQLTGYEPYLIVVENRNDLGYLRFVDCQLPVEDFDTDGRPFLASGYEAFLYTDRGVYRPGDSLHLGSVVRGRNSAVPQEFPYSILMYDPTGATFTTIRANTKENGFLTHSLSIPDFAKTGKYRMIARIGEDQVIGSVEFQVEEFVPDKIAVDISTGRTSYRQGETLNVHVNGKYLFGQPAKDHTVTGGIRIEPQQFSPAKYKTYLFGDDAIKFSPVSGQFTQGKLNDSGKCDISYKLPENLTPPSALKGLVSISVSEQGGRAVSDYAEITVHPYERYVGIKTTLDGYAEPGKQMTALLVVTDPDGNPVADSSVQVIFYREVWETIRRTDNTGRYAYLSERKLVVIDSQQIAVSAGGGSVEFTPSSYGSYRIAAIDMKGKHRSATSFYASGWGYAPWAMENPERIEIELDKESYAAGEEGTALIRAPFGGTLLLTIEKETVLDFMRIDMKENTATIPLKIKNEWYPNAYITATVIRNAKDITPKSPARAFGVAPLFVKDPKRILPVTITTSDVITSRSKLTVNLSAGTPGVTALTVAAVDIGITRLTDFKAPNPAEFFYGQRGLTLRLYDLYSAIFPEVEQAVSHLTTGGDRMFAKARMRHLNPVTARRVKSVALWSDKVMTDKLGNATVTFDVPEYNGALAVMVVGVQDDKYGFAEKEVLVRDKIVIQESFPRFIAPGDKADGIITVFNNTGADTAITVSLTVNGPAQIGSAASQRVHVPKNGEQAIPFTLTGGDLPGVVAVNAEATDGVNRSKISFELPNRPPQPLKTLYGSGVVTATAPVTLTLPSDWIAGSGEYVLRTSSLSSVTLGRNLEYLMRYPYGCLEQTTSRVFPLLYFASLARFLDSRLLAGNGAEYFVQEGLAKIESMMLPDGSFSYWPGEQESNPWSSVYASHFLLEAKAAGYPIENKTLRKVEENLKGIAAGRTPTSGLPLRVYAAFVLSRRGMLDQKILNSLRAIAIDSLPSYSRYQFAGILAAAGDGESARLLLPTEIQPANFEPETGGNFSSGVRTDAILLDVLNGIDPQNPSCAVLAKSLLDRQSENRWYTTQENAFALLALGKYLKGQTESKYTGKVMVGRDSSYTFTTADFKLSSKELGGKEISISIEGTGPCYYYWQSSGVPTDRSAEEFSRGIVLKREYLTADGQPLDRAAVLVGSQIICKITASAKDKTLNNVVINDLLPAGFEIENPRLQTSPRLAWLPSMKGSVQYQDMRDDRFLLFVTLTPGRDLEFYYSLRAITTGHYQIPPISAECMYNPLIGASGSSGEMDIR